MIEQTAFLKRKRSREEYKASLRRTYDEFRQYVESAETLGVTKRQLWELSKMIRADNRLKKLIISDQYHNLIDKYLERKTKIEEAKKA